MADGSVADGGALLSGQPGPAEAALGGKADKLVFRRRYVFFEDLVLGRLEKPLDSIRDLVIVRSDGSPVFHLANVVDDVDQGVTHILHVDHTTEQTHPYHLIFIATSETPPAHCLLPIMINDTCQPNHLLLTHF